MANVIKTFETTNFRCVKSIDKLTDSELHRHGYYRGYQCPHGHEIRDLEYHWCYECVIKIKSNICGFDLNFLSNDFKNKYYNPILQTMLSKKLLSFANTSIDISDGLIADLEKLINKQKLSYKLYLEDIPISNNLNKIIKLKLIKKITSISCGDDYQILFTADTSKSRIISKISKALGVKISKIGKICTHFQKPQIIDGKNKKITLKNKGYYHKF